MYDEFACRGVPSKITACLSSALQGRVKKKDVALVEMLTLQNHLPRLGPGFLTSPLMVSRPQRQCGFDICVAVKSKAAITRVAVDLIGCFCTERVLLVGTNFMQA